MLIRSACARLSALPTSFSSVGGATCSIGADSMKRMKHATRSAAKHWSATWTEASILSSLTTPTSGSTNSSVIWISTYVQTSLQLLRLNARVARPKRPYFWDVLTLLAMISQGTLSWSTMISGATTSETGCITTLSSWNTSCASLTSGTVSNRHLGRGYVFQALINPTMFCSNFILCAPIC
ncbi:hypothetical protein PF003_g30207 [Phytophthora fragariae]|nr:hypothetical protein PF003_g30207 [Phytophthora fragariae]